jgi:hypothetical protein
MVMISFRSKKDKEHLLEKAKQMEEYASMIVECIKESEYDESMERRSHDYDDEDEIRIGRHIYKRMAR